MWRLEGFTELQIPPPPATSLANSSLEAPTHHRPCLITPLPDFENHHSLQNSSQSSNQIGKIRLSESCFYTAEFGSVTEICGGYKWFGRGFWAALGTSSTLFQPKMGIRRNDILHPCA
jgi:hypothetical protein